MTNSLLASAADSALVVIDIQERLAAAMPPETLAAVIRNTRILMQAAELLGIPVLVTEQYPKGLGHTVADLPAAGTRIEKTRFSCGALDVIGRSQLILAGMEAHVCVLQSALELQATHHVFVAADAVCSRRAENRENALKRMRAAGVTVTNTESVVFEWLRDARHEHFKAISALVR